MEAVVFIGIQASGKTSFYLARFFTTHVRISLDLLRTRRRENRLLLACLEMKQPFVVDNTNPTLEDRAKYLGPARTSGFRTTGYYFPAPLGECIRRNNGRALPAQVPVRAIAGTLKKLQAPSYAEGFDTLYEVRLLPEGGFVVEEQTSARP